MTCLSSPLYVTGVAPNGKYLVAGLFRMQDQVGYPIDLCLIECKEKGFFPDILEALCDCWLNDCLKFDSFVRELNSPYPGRKWQDEFSMTGATVIAMFPKINLVLNPVDAACKYIMRKKRMGKWL
jgi:hypothetical protein